MQVAMGERPLERHGRLLVARLEPEQAILDGGQASKVVGREIAKVEHHLGELFPRVGFIVTTLTGTNRAVVRFYNQRGTAEQWIKEGKEAIHWTRLSCHRFRANEARLLLGVVAYNLAICYTGSPCR